ncbi:FAD:protein FMN transferase [bacterium]|nr:MAG: FAD:protein FMN transferase [bacterium]
MDNSRRNFLKQTACFVFSGTILNNIPYLSAQTRPALVERAFYTMGTIVKISAYGDSVRNIHQAITKAQEEFQRLDSVMSVYRSDSHVSFINKAAGRNEVPVDRSVIDILRSAKIFYEKTGGSFNICIEPMMRLWGFRNESKTISRMPSDRELYRAIETISINHLVINDRGNTAGLSNEGSAIDLGGIAVGYSVDRAAKILQSEGIENFLINHSGDIYASGTPPESSGWVISIPDPQKPSDLIKTVSIRDRAVSTSGNYESFVAHLDKKFGHILDPQTGYPCDRLLSLTTVCSTAMEADAYSTGYFCNGNVPAEMTYIAVTSDAKVFVSNNI